MFLLFQTIDFPQRFFETPTLVTTTKHLKDDVNSRIDADNNSITVWIEVRICLYLIFSQATIRGIFLSSFISKEKHILEATLISDYLKCNAINTSYPGPYQLTGKRGIYPVNIFGIVA